jgi:hypothetical protein
MVRPEVDFVDIIAEKDDHRIYVEVKAATAAPGLNVDTAIGQLVRRIRRCRLRWSFGDSHARWRLRCERLSRFWICWGMSLYAVGEDGGVRQLFGRA